MTDAAISGIATVTAAVVLTSVPATLNYLSARATRLEARVMAAAAKAASDRAFAVAEVQTQAAATTLAKIEDTTALTHKLVNSQADAAKDKNDADTQTIKELTTQVATLTAQVSSLTNVLVSKTVTPEKSGP